MEFFKNGLIIFLFAVGGLIALVIILSPLFFTFSRGELALAPRKAELYLSRANKALDSHDLVTARKYLDFVELYSKELEYSARANEMVVLVGERYAQQTKVLADLRLDSTVWREINMRYGNYRDGFYQEARAQWGLGNRSEAVMLLEKSLSLDPQFDEAKAALSEINTK